jgi:hypothetical protein
VATAADTVSVFTAPAKDVVIPAVGDVLAVKVASEVTTVEFGSVRAQVAVAVIADADVASTTKFRSAVTVDPTAKGAADVPVPAMLVTEVVAVVTALAGIDVRTPNPSDTAATSAMRLKLVFVDIFFLSIVDTRTIRVSACAKRPFSFVMRVSFCTS